MKKTAIIALSAALLCSCTKKEADKTTLSGLDPAKFETTVDGKPVALYVLKNAEGMEAAITNFGGRIVSVMVPDRDGNMTDVVLGHDSIADYINIDGNFGGAIGRYGNRINQGRFSIDGVEYQLPQNNFGHCLHGGINGFHKTVWDANQLNDSTLELHLATPDGYEGFPGNVNVQLTYALTADNGLSISYEATTDAPTILNLTNHSYFNLSGDPSKDILDEIVWIDADNFTPIDSTFMTTGEITPVAGTPFDFTTPKTVGQDIDADNEQLVNGRGYDHNFVLNNPGDFTKPKANIYDPSTGIMMEVFTDEPGLQYYVGNFLDGTVSGKHGIAYPRRSAICMESQHFPDSPNKPEWPSVVVRPGETYTSHCIYRFLLFNNN